MKDDIEFRVAIDRDIPLFLKWSEKSFIKDIWLFEEYNSSARAYIKGVVGGNGYDYPFIILDEGKPIGYIQYCDLYAYRNICTDLKGVFTNEDEGSYCIDLFIGEEEYLGKGYGSIIVQRFCDMLFLKVGVKRILIDPWVENIRAIRCYEKAGFQYIREEFDGVRQVQVMGKVQ